MEGDWRILSIEGQRPTMAEYRRKCLKTFEFENEQNVARVVPQCRYYFNLNNDKILRVADEQQTESSCQYAPHPGRRVTHTHP